MENAWAKLHKVLLHMWLPDDISQKWAVLSFELYWSAVFHKALLHMRELGFTRCYCTCDSLMKFLKSELYCHFTWQMHLWTDFWEKSRAVLHKTLLHMCLPLQCTATHCNALQHTATHAAIQGRPYTIRYCTCVSVMKIPTVASLCDENSW
jgi:hypothetical protein